MSLDNIVVGIGSNLKLRCYNHKMSYLRQDPIIECRTTNSHINGKLE